MTLGKKTGHARLFWGLWFVSDTGFDSESFQSSSGALLFGLTILTLCIRLFNLEHPSLVVFDEVHFGRYAANYLGKKYFFDVHPPLAKLFVAFSGWLGGLSSTFLFNLLGLDYLESEVPYLGMRLFSALCGSIMVPVAFFTCRAFGIGKSVSLLSALLVLFENSFVTQFRFIFLDSYLVAGTALTIYFYARFKNYHNNHFSLQWWFYLISTGVCLGLTISCKWVGLFTVATIGIATVFELWRVFGDVNIDSKKLASHVLIRFMCLLVLPVLIYVFSFWVHFAILSRSGSGIYQMSILFRQSFKTERDASTFSDVGYGSVVTMKNLKTNSFLHSHSKLYPKGSEQQQVTLYPFSDINNEWMIMPRHPDPWGGKSRWNVWPGNLSSLDMSFIPLRHGDRIRLVHMVTRRTLHSHVVDPPISNRERHWEVSGYGVPEENIGDTNDDWIVIETDRFGNEISHSDTHVSREELSSKNFFLLPKRPDPSVFSQERVQKEGEEEDVVASIFGFKKEEEEEERDDRYEDVERMNPEDPVIYPAVIARRTFFKLVHGNTGCELTCFGKKLPEWGFNQTEATCGRGTLRENSVWVFHTNTHPLCKFVY